MAIDARASIELDVAIANDGSYFIGHPLEFYDFKGMPRPQNLPLDVALDQIYEAGLFLAIDCKGIKTLPKIKEIITRFGVERCQFHAWSRDLLFKPYPLEIIQEPHWKHEDLPTEAIVQLKNETSVPVAMAVRGLTQERLAKEGNIITDKIINIAKGKAESIYFYLPNGEAPPMRFMDKLLEQGLLTYLNIDHVPEAERPRLYHGMTDKIELATKFC